MPLPRRNSQSGFSLLETLIAFAVMSFSIAAIYQVSIGAMGTTARQLQLYELTEFARSQLDEYIETGSNHNNKGTYNNTWDWRISVEKSGLLPPSYLDKTHYLAEITVQVFPIGRTDPQVSYSTLDFRKKP